MIHVTKPYKGVLSKRQTIDVGLYVDNSPRLFGLDSWLIEAGYATKPMSVSVSVDMAADAPPENAPQVSKPTPRSTAPKAR